MSHGNDREHDLLLAAVAQITSGLCLWCPTRRAVIRWSQPSRRWQIVVVHRPRCCATRSVVHRRRADEFLHGLLELYGLLVAHYGEDDMIMHCKVMVL